MINFKSKTTMLMITCVIGASFSLSNFFSTPSSYMDFSNENVGWVGEEPIKNIDFLKYKELLKTQDPNISNEDIIKKIGERKATILYGRNHLNLRVTDDEVRTEIRENELFQVDGKFNPQIYKSHLSEVKITPKSYEESVRENLLLEKLIKITDIRNDSKASQKVLSDSLFQVLNLDLYEARYKFQEVETPSEEDILSKYNEHRDVFIEDFSYEASVQKFEANDDFFKKEWEKYKKNPENIFDIKQILVNSEKDFMLITSKLKEGEDFDQLLKTYSIDKSSFSNDGLIEGLKEKELTPDFVKGLNSDQDIFTAKSSLGYHIVKRVSKVTEDISLDYFKKYFEQDLLSRFKEQVKNNNLKPKINYDISLSKLSAKDLLGDNISVGSETILGDNFVLEKIIVKKINQSRFLNIENKNDYKQIVEIVKNQNKLKNAISLSLNIENEYKKHKWIKKDVIEINKNSELPQELKDVIFTTEIGQKNDLILGDKYYVFIVNEQKHLKTKDKDFKNIMDYMYNLESGYLLIDEALKYYPVKIVKKLVTE